MAKKEHKKSKENTKTCFKMSIHKRELLRNPIVKSWMGHTAMTACTNSVHLVHQYTIIEMVHNASLRSTDNLGNKFK